MSLKEFSGEKSGNTVLLNISDDFVCLVEQTSQDIIDISDALVLDDVEEMWLEATETIVQKDGEAEGPYYALFTSRQSPGHGRVCLAVRRVKEIGRELGLRPREATEICRAIRRMPLAEQREVVDRIAPRRHQILLEGRDLRLQRCASRQRLIRKVMAELEGADAVDRIADQLRVGPNKWVLTTSVVVGEHHRKLFFSSHLACILGTLVRRGAVLAPARRQPLGQRGLVTPQTEGYLAEIFKPVPDNFRLSFASALLASADSAYAAGTSRKARVAIGNFLACTTCAEAGDLSGPLISAHFSAYLEGVYQDAPKTAISAKKEGKRLVTALLKTAHAEYPDWSLLYENPTKRQKGGQRGRDFSWVIGDPDLGQWADLFASYLRTRRGQLEPAVAALNTFLEALLWRRDAGQQIPRAPEDLAGPVDFYDPDFQERYTLWDYLNTLKSKKPGSSYGKDLDLAQKTRRAVEIWNMLQWLDRTRPGFTNPMFKDDFRFTNRMNKGRTGRVALDDPIIRALREVLVDFQRSSDGSIEAARFPLAETLGQDTYDVFDKERCVRRKECWPGLSILLFILLSVPIRTFQARWLDSGVLDALLYDPIKDAFVPNPAGIEGCRNGVLREIPDTAFGLVVHGLYINTNKTQIFGSGITGYEIPWISDELKYLIAYLRDWYQRFQIGGGVSYRQPIQLYQNEGKEIADEVRRRMPYFVPLFREVRSVSDRPPLAAVVSYSRLRRFYQIALGAAEEALNDSGRLPRRLVTWTTRADGSRVTKAALVDLHTLRVTGITALFERGVPVDIIAEFVAGHATVLLTLYYRNRGPRRVREMLVRGQEELVERNFDSGGHAVFLEDEDYASEYLFASPEFDRDASEAVFRDAARAAIYHLTDGGSGICPGTICSEGGWDFDANRPAAVEGGDSSCGNCRFWRTGPAFLNGQVAALNELMYEIHGLTGTVMEERRGVRQARTALDENKEDNRRRVLLHQYESRLRTAELILTAKLKNWGSRYRLLMLSVQKLADTEKKLQERPDQTPQTVKNPGIEVSSAEASPYALAHWLCVQAEVAPQLGTHLRAQVDLEHAVAALCDRNHLPNFLFKLDKPHRLRAANLFVEALLGSEQLAHASPTDINAVFEGGNTLAQLGLHDVAAHVADHVVGNPTLSGLSEATELRQATEAS